MEKVTTLLLISLLAGMQELQLQCRLPSHQTSLLPAGKKVPSQRLQAVMEGRTADYSAHGAVRAHVWPPPTYPVLRLLLCYPGPHV